MLPRNYLITLLLHNMILALILWLLGVWVVQRGVRTNYTRKLNHLALFSLPFLMALILPYQPTRWTITTSACAFVATTLVFHPWIRARSRLVSTAFASIDRPEDRPYTLLWIVTQSMAAYAALIIVFQMLSKLERPELIGIPLLVTAIGDGLAEPVGIRFGRHHYRVPSLAGGRYYQRTLEGSACVFVAAALIVLAPNWNLSRPQLIALLVLLPPVMTCVEAFSPHTWDAPFLYFSGGTTVTGVLAAIPTAA